LNSDASIDIPLNRDAHAIVERAGAIARQRGTDSATSNDVLQATSELQPQLVSEVKPSADGEASVSLQRVLINAGREAQSLGHPQVTPLHLLLALLYTDSPSTALPLQQAGLSLYGVRQRAQVQPPRPAVRGGVISVSPVFLGIVGIGVVAGGLLWSDLVPGLVVPITIAFVVAGWIASLCIHEFGHALVAYLGGDRSVAAAGYLTLNPLRYTNATLSIVLPVVFLLLGGIALPGGAVYINHSALRSKSWSSAVSLAGPGGTFVCWLAITVAFGALFRSGVVTNENLGFFAALAVLGFYMTFALVLNLLPVPGLDGFGVIRPWLSFQLQYSLMRYGTIAIIGVYVVLWFVAPVRDAFFRLIFQITTVAGIPLDLIFVGLFNMRIVQ
jgi:Zn-dependent protease